LLNKGSQDAYFVQQIKMQ